MVKFIAGAIDDGYGTSVAVSGGAAAAATLASLTVVVGAPGNDDKATNAGAAYVYKVSAAGAVAAQTKLLAPDGELYDKFGTSVVGLYVHVESS
jgi:hypothetical protein